MTPMFDIFRTESDGSLRWCESADSLETAKTRVQALAASGPAQYVIVNHETGERMVMDRVPVGSQPAFQSSRAGAGKQAWYHICRVDKEKLRWVEAAENLQVAEARIKVLKAFDPGDYLVLDYNPESDSPTPWSPLTVVLSTLGL